MDDEKRIVGGYDVINSVHIGDREIVLGLDMSTDCEMYLR